MNKQEIAIKAFIEQKHATMRNEENYSISEFVRKCMVHLWQLRLWDDVSQNILKDHILMWCGWIEEPEFCNGQVKLKRTEK